MDQGQLLTLWIPLLAAGALLIRVGQAAVGVGAARSKNAGSAVARSLFELALSVLVFAFAGIYLLTSGTSARFLSAQADVPLNFAALTLHFTVLALIASGLLVPATAGRSKWIVPMAGSLLVSLVLFPLAARWVWYGWLGHLGIIDISGALPVHLTGALVGAVGAYCVGARTGKYNHDGSTNIIPSHQGALPPLGILLMVAGWLPYVMSGALLHENGAGSAALARSALNALVAAAGGVVGSTITVRARAPRMDLTALCAGLLGGAVAMTAAGGTIAPWEAAVLGLVAGWLTPIALQWLDFKCRIDDPSGLIAPHGVGAVVALFGAALFAPLNIGGKLRAVGIACLGIGCVAVLTIALAWVVLAAVSRFGGLRVNEADEFDGLDLAEHDMNAYPDFQQTTIKSYHTREA
jgi:Amt family ammonium transporter